MTSESSNDTNRSNVEKKTPFFLFEFCTQTYPLYMYMVTCSIVSCTSRKPSFCSLSQFYRFFFFSLFSSVYDILHLCCCCVFMSCAVSLTHSLLIFHRCRSSRKSKTYTKHTQFHCHSPINSQITMNANAICRPKPTSYTQWKLVTVRWATQKSLHSDFRFFFRCWLRSTRLTYNSKRNAAFRMSTIGYRFYSSIATPSNCQNDAIDMFQSMNTTHWKAFSIFFCCGSSKPSHAYLLTVLYYKLSHQTHKHTSYSTLHTWSHFASN